MNNSNEKIAAGLYLISLGDFLNNDEAKKDGVDLFVRGIDEEILRKIGNDIENKPAARIRKRRRSI